MTTERCLELFYDAELQAFIRERCRNRVHDEQMQADCFAAAWSWISANAPDDMDIDSIKHWASCAIVNAYRKELRQRHLKGALLELCIQEDGEIRDYEPYGHRWDAGMTPEFPK
jgi:hypothetical protein